MNHRRDEGRNASHFLNRSAELTDREIDREKKFGWKRGWIRISKRNGRDSSWKKRAAHCFSLSRLYKQSIGERCHCRLPFIGTVSCSGDHGVVRIFILSIKTEISTVNVALWSSVSSECLNVWLRMREDKIAGAHVEYEREVRILPRK